MKKVMVFGTFDILHPGHFDFLKQSKKYGEFLIVVLARDKTVLQVKKKKPVHNEKHRLQTLKRIDLADKIVLGYLRDKYRIIEKLNPDTICLGYDQNSFTTALSRELHKRNIRARVVRLQPYKQHKYKSSKIRSASRKKQH